MQRVKLPVFANLMSLVVSGLALVALNMPEDGGHFLLNTTLSYNIFNSFVSILCLKEGGEEIDILERQVDHIESPWDNE